MGANRSRRGPALAWASRVTRTAALARAATSPRTAALARAATPRRAAALAFTVALALTAVPAAAAGPAPASGPPSATPTPSPTVAAAGDDVDGDYGPDNTAWNGLRDFFALARGLGLRPELHADIVWDDLGDDTALFVLYPRGTIDANTFVSYVGGGGRLVLADDFGTSEALLERLGLTRHHGEARAHRLYQDNPNLPVARAFAQHELTRDVEEVVTNHPAWLRGGLIPVLGFGPGDIVCAAGQLGDGTIVLLSDPSVLINNMLELSGNLAFAANLLRYVARPGDRVVVVTGHFGQRGAPRRGWAPPAAAGASGAPGMPPPPPGPLQAFLREFNSFLGALANATPSEATLRALLWVAAAGALIVLLFLLAGGTVRTDGAWAHGGRPPRSAFEEVVRRYGSGRSPVGSAMLASLLRDEVEARLCRDLGLDPVSALDPARAVPRARACLGAGAALVLARLLPQLLRVPPTERVFGTYASMSRRKLARLHAQVESLFATLESAPQRTEDDA
jgi:hypothetical protein